MNRRIRALSRTRTRSAALLFSLALTTGAASAIDWASFSCAVGTQNTISLVPASDTGYNAAKLYDNDQYQGWSTGLNQVAEARFSLSATATVREVHIYKSPYHAASGSFEVFFLNSAGTQIGSGTIAINADGWLKSSFNVANVATVRVRRDAGEDLFEMRVCTGGAANQPPTTPTAPNPAHGATITTGAYNLAWGPSTDPEGQTITYDVVVKNSSNAQVAACSNVSNSNRICAISLANGTYTWQVTAKDSLGATSTPSNWTFTISATTPPITCAPSLAQSQVALPRLKADGHPLPANQSGCAVSGQLDPTNPGTYWANHQGVVGYNLSQACKDLHDAFWTFGPNGKVYPTWHPAKVVHPVTQVTCYFGHEHGDYPGNSRFYTDITRYQQQRIDGFIPVPFGYANDVYAANGGMRHEDHFGHKIFVEKFEAAQGNSANAGNVTPKGVICDALLKLHQGTHSPDALSNHLHEAIAHIDCTALPGFVATRSHVTTLVPMGRPTWFSNVCGPYPVPNQTLGTNNSGENNAPSNLTAMATSPAVFGSSPYLRDNPTPTEYTTAVDGERIIPAAACVATYLPSNSPKANRYRFGHEMMETWVRPLSITNTAATTRFFFLKSYYSVMNPARVFSLNNGQVTTQATIDVCKTPPAALPGQFPPNIDSGLCAAVKTNPQATQFSTVSPYNGTIRNVNFKGVQIGGNEGRSTPTILSDEFGRERPSNHPDLSNPAKTIKQYVSVGYNGWAGNDIQATIRTTGTTRVCRLANGTYPTGLATNDPCYWDGHDDLRWAKEWWRDYNVAADQIHAPN
jgi:hypothetical protein